jgi:hypothetical protein
MSPKLTVAETAVIAKRAEITIRRALEAGTLHGFQQMRGGKWSISETCLEAWLEGRKCEHRSNVTAIRRSA